MWQTESNNSQSHEFKDNWNTEKNVSSSSDEGDTISFNHQQGKNGYEEQMTQNYDGNKMLRSSGIKICYLTKAVLPLSLSICSGHKIPAVIQ
jgi:hypothetical protein